MDIAEYRYAFTSLVINHHYPIAKTNCANTALPFLHIFHVFMPTILLPHLPSNCPADTE
jgi:hypothetical protein